MKDEQLVGSEKNVAVCKKVCFFELTLHTTCPVDVGFLVCFGLVKQQSLE